MLTLSTIALDSRTGLPKVHYATALDWFIICSFLYCMGSLLEFAGVHYFTKVDSKLPLTMTLLDLKRFHYKVGSGEVFSINEEPLEKVKELNDWEDLDESFTTLAAFNHVYGAKDYSYNSELQTKICLAHNNSSSQGKYEKVGRGYRPGKK